MPVMWAHVTGVGTVAQEGHVPKREGLYFTAAVSPLRDAFCGLGYICEVMSCGVYSSTRGAGRGLCVYFTYIPARVVCVCIELFSGVCVVCACVGCVAVCRCAGYAAEGGASA
jgi:hypothetical protein